MRNEAIRCSEFYDIMAAIPQKSSALEDFLQQVMPQRPPQEAELYQTTLENAIRINDGVYGIVASKDNLIDFRINTKQTNFIPLEEKLGEGFSICPHSFGVCLTGGKTSPRKGWIYFLANETSYFCIDLPSSFFTHCSVFFNDFVYLIGGRNDNIVKRDCHSFNIRTRNWERIDDLKIPRSYSSICELRNCLYVFGGVSQSNAELNSIERYQDGCWTVFDIMMPTCLLGVSAMPIDDTRVLICGGKFDRNKSNMKIYRLDLVKATFSTSTAGQRLGIMSSCYPSFQRDNIYIYNQNGELIEYVRNTGELKKYRKPIYNAWVGHGLIPSDQD